MNFTFGRNILPEKLFSAVDELDSFDWSHLFLDYIVNSIMIHGSVWDKEGKPSGELTESFLTAAVMMNEALAKYPVVILDPTIETLVEDTVPSLKGIKVPYPAFFVNKKFDVGKGKIVGMCVTDIHEFTYNTLLTTGMGKEKAKTVLHELESHPKIGNEPPEMSFVFIYVDDEIASFVMSGTDEIYQRDPSIRDDVFEIMKKAMFYSANISNLITSHVDLDNPTNPKRNVRIIPHYKSADGAKAGSNRENDKRFSIIRVFGDLKTYTNSYNKERRKYHKIDDKAIFVRGHYRTFKAERYKAKRGETVWIPPFIKGMDKELHNRLIKLTK